MRTCQRVVMAGTLILRVASGGVGWQTTIVEAKTSVLYCGSPGNCNAHPYKAHGGWQSICAQNSPCYLTEDCKGEQVCESPPHPHSN